MTTKDNASLEDYIFQAEAARIAGITKQTMSKLVHRGSFTTKVVAGRILVLRSEVELFVARPQGRPTKEMQARKKPLKNPLEASVSGTFGKYISQSDAARIRGVSKQAIANLVNRGRLSTVSVAGRTLVIRSQVETFEPQPSGHPFKKKTSTKTTKQKRSKK